MMMTSILGITAGAVACFVFLFVGFAAGRRATLDEAVGHDAGYWTVNKASGEKTWVWGEPPRNAVHFDAWDRSNS